MKYQKDDHLELTIIKLDDINYLIVNLVLLVIIVLKQQEIYKHYNAHMDFIDLKEQNYPYLDLLEHLVIQEDYLLLLIACLVTVVLIVLNQLLV